MISFSRIARRTIIIGALTVGALIALTGCQLLGLGASGSLSMNLTDAPMTATNVSGVYITINSIDINVNGSWKTFNGFTGPKTINLLDFANGQTSVLGTGSLPAGNYTQVRFNLNIPQLGTSNPSNPGCYLAFTDGTTAPLFVPSGGQTGYKAVGSFSVPVNGSVGITADFNVAQMVVDTGSTGTSTSTYLLRPTIRLQVSNQAGTISGSVTSSAPSTDTLVVYAYDAGTYTNSESSPPSGTPPFGSAVTSAAVSATGSYSLSFLAPGSYDLVVAAFASDGSLDTAGLAPAVDAAGVNVTSSSTTTKNLSL